VIFEPREQRVTTDSPAAGWTRTHRLARAAAAFLALANGVVAIAYPVTVRLHERPNLFGIVLPFGLHHWGRLLTPLFGFLLAYLAFHLWRGRRVAWWVAVIAAAFAIAAHIAKGDAVPLAFGAVALLLMLLYARRVFTVHSDPWTMAQGIALAGLVLALAAVYGTAGFLYLDERDFGHEISTHEALTRTGRQVSLIGNPDLHPHTRHAHWFLDSLEGVTFTSLGLVILSVGMPLRNRYQVQPRDREDMRRMLAEHGGNAADYFKLWPGKSYLFTARREAGVAYGVSTGVAVALGNPVGHPPQLDAAVAGFVRLCRDNAWLPAFHQISPQYVEICRRHGLGALKIGEEASIPLQRFVAATARRKAFRNIRNRFEREGFRCERHEPPVPPATLEELHTISNEWLSLPGRRERGFTLGAWTDRYPRDTVVYVVRAKTGEAVAFANLVPSYRAGETAVDLMRHRPTVVNGTMDFLFLEMLTDLHGRGLEWFSMGMAPFAGIGDEPGASLEERAIHELYQRLNRFFSYKGLRSFKAKYEPEWEGRYLAYGGGPLGLARTTVALTRLTEGNR
jgi:phosphatidylglycerol lysyltransferase